MNKALDLAVEKCLEFRLAADIMSCGSCDAWYYFFERNLPLPCANKEVDVYNIEYGGRCVNCKKCWIKMFETMAKDNKTL